MKNNKKIWFVIPVMALAVACGGGKEESKEGEEKKEDTKEVPVKKAGELKMAYIDLDTINAHYKLVKLRTDELMVEQERIGRELNGLKQSVISQQQKIEKEIQYLPLSEQKTAQEKYMRLTENYAKKEEELMGKLQDKQAEMLMQMNEILTEKLAEIAKRDGYDMILKQSAQLQMFYMDPKFDITKQILDELNTDFEKANTGK